MFSGLGISHGVGAQQWCGLTDSPGAVDRLFRSYCWAAERRGATCRDCEAAWCHIRGRGASLGRLNVANLGDPEKKTPSLLSRICLVGRRICLLRRIAICHGSQVWEAECHHKVRKSPSITPWICEQMWRRDDALSVESPHILTYICLDVGWDVWYWPGCKLWIEQDSVSVSILAK